MNSLPKKLNVGLVTFDGTAQVDVTPTTDRLGGHQRDQVPLAGRGHGHR